jgi:hypothetical protein
MFLNDEIKGCIIERLSSVPVTGVVDGRIYYDTTLGCLRKYKAATTSWHTVADAGNSLVNIDTTAVASANTGDVLVFNGSNSKWTLPGQFGRMDGYHSDGTEGIFQVLTFTDTSPAIDVSVFGKPDASQFGQYSSVECWVFNYPFFPGDPGVASFTLNHQGVSNIGQWSEYKGSCPSIPAGTYAFCFNPLGYDMWMGSVAHFVSMFDLQGSVAGVCTDASAAIVGSPIFNKCLDIYPFTYPSASGYCSEARLAAPLMLTGGNIDVGGVEVVNSVTPTTSSSLVTKSYADTHIGGLTSSVTASLDSTVSPLIVQYSSVQKGVLRDFTIHNTPVYNVGSGRANQQFLQFDNLKSSLGAGRYDDFRVKAHLSPATTPMWRSCWYNAELDLMHGIGYNNSGANTFITFLTLNSWGSSGPQITSTNLSTGMAMTVDHYRGGAYLPSMGRYYLAPYGQSNTSTWHYIKTNMTGAPELGSYGVTATGVTGAYSGAVTHNNKVFFVPSKGLSTLHYIDAGGNVGTYANPYSADFAASEAYSGGCMVGKWLIFYPDKQWDKDYLHYVDTDSRTVGRITNSFKSSSSGSLVSDKFTFGCYDPLRGVARFAPRHFTANSTEAAAIYSLNGLNTPVLESHVGTSVVISTAYSTGMTFIPSIGGSVLIPKQSATSAQRVAVEYYNIGDLEPFYSPPTSLQLRNHKYHTDVVSYPIECGQGAYWHSQKGIFVPPYYADGRAMWLSLKIPDAVLPPDWFEYGILRSGF